jgi:hypothetical protein
MIIWKIFGLIFLMRILTALPMQINAMRKMRAPKNYKNVLFSDNEAVINGMDVDPAERRLDYLLEITRWILGAVLLWVLCFDQTVDSALTNGNFIITVYVWAISLLSILLAGGFIGGGMVKPFWNKLAPRRFYALSDQGVLYAGRIFAWRFFNSYRVEEEHPYIYLWSAAKPNIVLFYFTPDSQEKSRVIAEILQQYLPKNARADSAAAKGSTINFLWPGSISILSLAVGIIAARYPMDLTPLIISIVIIVHFFVSYWIYKGIVPLDKLARAETQ